MEGKRKGKQGRLSEDPRLDAALWELADVLAEIAASAVNHRAQKERGPDGTHPGTNNADPNNDMRSR